MSIRGEDHPVAGLAGVATPPEHRREGYVARLLAASLAEYRDRDQPFAALWPFDFGFYRQYGWARAGTHAHYECAPEALRGVADRSGAGTFRRLDRRDADSTDRDADPPAPETIAALDTVLDGHNERFELTMKRSPEWWRYRVFEGDGKDPYVYGWERGGELRGYLVYTIEADEQIVLETTEMASLDNEARVALLGFLANHDAQVDRVRFEGVPETGLFDLVYDPEAIECSLVSGPMVRVVDVPRALEALSYPPGVEAAFSLSVRDPIADWNDRPFDVRVADGAATCRPKDANVGDSPGVSVDASVDINTLSQLCVGHCSAERAAFTGALRIESAALEATFESLFSPGEVYLREFF